MTNKELEKRVRKLEQILSSLIAGLAMDMDMSGYENSHSMIHHHNTSDLEKMLENDFEWVVVDGEEVSAVVIK